MTDLIVARPMTRTAERDYILDVMLREFLGQSFATETGPGGIVTIRRPGDSSTALTMPDVLLAMPDELWLHPRSLPARPLTSWNVRADLPETTRCADLLPILYPGPLHAPHFRQDASGIHLNADLFGGAFLLLTRYEELVRPERDDHDRFSAHSSLAQEERFLDRPLVNEWLEVLRNCLRRLWPALRFRDRTYRLVPSHDVDRPWIAQNRPLKRVLRSLGADLLLRREPTLAMKRTASYLTRNIDADPGNRFDWIMDRSEEIDARSTFFFLVRKGQGPYDADYTPRHPWIQRLLQRIHARGHRIGLHTSYDTFRDPSRTREEIDFLKTCCASLGIEQEEWGIRQHYLRWENPTTWRNAAESGVDFDSTLSFADHAGFRCGTCYEYPVFDLVRRQPLRLRERPLIAMEGSLLTYQGLSQDEAGRRMLALADTCRRFAGDFVLLWHNDCLATRRDRNTYNRVIAAQPTRKPV
jgi:hypothetical protein